MSRQCPTSCLVATGLLGSLFGWACPALAANDDPSLGQEYIDMPPAPAEAEAAKPPEPPRKDENPTAGYIPGYRRTTSVGLSPLSPEYSSALPGAMAPSFGAPQEGKAWRFDFHGYMQGGLRAGIGTRANALESQHKLTLHGDPAVAGASYGWFEHSNTVPGPWTQLNFIYGNETVQATAILGAWSVSESMQAAGFFQAPAQQGVVDAFLAYTPDVSPIALKLITGAYQDRYGAMDKYSEGAYGVSLIGSIYGVGTTATVELPFEGDWTLRAEAGFKGQLTRPPIGIVSDGSNENARPWEGSTYAAHAHIGASYENISPTLHYIRSFSQDDLPDPPDNPGVRKDATLEVLGADVRWDGKRFGYFYFGAQRTRGTNTKTLGRLVTVLNGGDGNEFMQRFWGYDSNGTGTLFLTGGQYSLSLGTLLRYPTEFWGDAPDLIVSLFGIYGHVTSPVALFDDKDMLKAGTEVTYSFFPWMAAAGRADYVAPDMNSGSKSFGILSPKLVFRTDWKTRETLTLQYSRYLLGDEVVVKGDNRLLNIPSGKPDRHLVSLFATMWW